LASTNRRAAPARSRRSAPRGSKRRTGPKKKFFDYPRTGFHGLHRWLPSWRVVVGTFLGVAFLGAGSVVAAYALTEVPDASAADVEAQTTTVYFAPNDDGTPGPVMGTFSTQKRTIVEYEDLPKYVGQATAAAEDKQFYSSSSGISITGMGRALINNLKGGRTEGGSTLTQQYVERYYVGSTTTDYVGKAKETLLAIKIAKTQTKPEIMGRYLNSIYYGRDSYGIQAAAQSYFGVDAAALTVEQAALLAGIIPSPNNWDPAVSPAKAEARWNIVLDSMVEEGWVTGEARAAMVFPPTIVPVESNTWAGTNGYLLEMVVKELAAEPYKLDRDKLNRGGYSVVTTIKQPMQDNAVAQVNAFMAGGLEGQRGIAPDPHVRASLTSVDPKDGAILALYGGPDYIADGKNRATFDKVQIGSTAKPFALLAALQQGIPLTTKFSGRSPMVIPGWDGSSTDPAKNTVRNAEAGHGTNDLVEATADSVNTIFAQLNMQVGAEATQKAASDAGISAEDFGALNANVLGTGLVRPLEMAGAYATIASGGYQDTPFIVRTVSDSKGNVAFEHKAAHKQVFAADIVADTTYAMQQVVQSGTAKDWVKPLDRPIAGKTGTTNENKSAWFIGFTPNIVTEVSLHQTPADGPGFVSITVPPGSKTKSGRTLKSIHGGDWPAMLWASYMKPVFDMPAYAQVLDFPPRANVGGKAKPTTAPTPEETVEAPAPTQEAPQQVAVPSGLEGKLEADATASVVNAGLSPVIVSESSDSVTAGRVIRIDPGSGTMLARDGNVTLVISTGPKEQPAPDPTETAPPPAP